MLDVVHSTYVPKEHMIFSVIKKTHRHRPIPKGLTNLAPSRHDTGLLNTTITKTILMIFFVIYYNSPEIATKDPVLFSLSFQRNCQKEHNLRKKGFLLSFIYMKCVQKITRIIIFLINDLFNLLHQCYPP